MRLVFAFAVGVAGFADFVGLEEDDLTKSLVRVDARRKRRGVRDLQRDETFPLRLERSHVNNDSAAGVSALSDADCKDAARDLEVFDGAREGKGVGRDDADVGLDGDEGFFVEALGVYQGVIDVSEDFEFVGDAQVVAVGGKSVGDHALANLLLGEGVDHIVFFGHLADPAVALEHETPWKIWKLGDFVIL